MSSSVTINGKMYMPSTMLSASYGYTSDYISKLAREEKVLGTQIGRTWFVEPESLKLFLHQVEVNKQIRKEELSRQRKLEQVASKVPVEIPKVLPQKESRQTRSLSLAVSAIAQASLILFCGIFAGSLFWTASQNGVGVSEFVSSAHETASFMLASLDPIRSRNAQPVSVAATEAAFVDERNSSKQAEIFADLPQFPDRLATTSASSTGSAGVSVSFSDEVNLVKDSDGQVMVEPVFANASGSIRYRLEPVKGAEK